MAVDELLLLHSPSATRRQGGSRAMRRCVRYKRGKGGVRRCAKFSGGGGRGGRRTGGILGGLGQMPALGRTTSLKATFGDVRNVAITAGIGAAGAIVTDMVFDQLTANVEMLAGLTGYKRALAEAATGIAIGIAVGKLAKNPRLGAKIAAGPLVLAALRIAGEMLNAGPFKAGGSLGDLGMMAIEPFRPELSGAEAQGELGAMQVGKGTPSWMLTPEGNMAGLVGGI